MASLMYGAGLRLLECAELRVKDLHLERGEVIIRDGKGGKDQVTVLSAALKPLVEHLSRVKAQRDADLTAGRGTVALPGSLRVKYPNAPREWAWQWVFSRDSFLARRRDRGAPPASLARISRAASGEGRYRPISGYLSRGIRAKPCRWHIQRN